MPFAIALLLCAALSSALDPRDTISWEAHGRDDVREWRAGIIKVC
jgi:hypothetical protein